MPYRVGIIFWRHINDRKLSIFYDWQCYSWELHCKTACTSILLCNLLAYRNSRIRAVIVEENGVSSELAANPQNWITDWQAAVVMSVREFPEVISTQKWLQFFFELIIRKRLWLKCSPDIYLISSLLRNIIYSNIYYKTNNASKSICKLLSIRWIREQFSYWKGWCWELNMPTFFLIIVRTVNTTSN